MTSGDRNTSSTFEYYEPIEWSAEEELQLFSALDGLKPVGVNKHFYMVCIVERLSKSLHREVSPEAVWAHLRTLYKLDLLDEMEPLPFPNRQRDFALPDVEFGVFLSNKRNEEKRLSLDENLSNAITTQPPPPSIIAVITDNTTKDRHPTTKTASAANIKELEKKIIAKMVEAPKRTPKRTRGSISVESNSPSTTPPPVQSSKRRRI